MKKNLLSLSVLLLIAFCTNAQTIEVDALLAKFIDKDSLTVQKDLAANPEVKVFYIDDKYSFFGGKKGDIQQVTLKASPKISFDGKTLNNTFLIGDIIGKHRLKDDYSIINSYAKDKKTYILLKYHYKNITYYNSRILIETAPALFSSDVVKNELSLKDPSKIKHLSGKIVEITVINESAGIPPPMMEGRAFDDNEADPLMRAKILIQNQKYAEAKAELQNFKSGEAEDLRIKVMVLLGEYAEVASLLNKRIASDNAYSIDYIMLHEIYLLSGQSKKIISGKKDLNKIYPTPSRVLFTFYSALADLEATGNMGTAEKNITEVLPFVNFKDFKWDFTLTKNYIETSPKIKSPAKTKALALIQKIEAANY